MASTYTANQGLEKPATGDRSGTWGTMTNTNMDMLDRSISGVGALSLTGTTTTLTTSDGSASDGNYKVLVLGGSPSGTNTITLSPNEGDKLYFVVNASGQSVIFSQGTGANVTIANGAADIIYADGAGGGAAVASLLANDLVFGGTLTVGVDDTGYDVKLFGATSGKYWLWDESADGVVQQGTLTVGVDDTGYDVKLFGATSGKYWLWDESADGAVQQGTLTVGVDDTGYDVKFFGATSGAYMLWDESADDLVLAGAAGLIIPDGGNIGSASDTDALSLSAAGALTATAGGAAATPAYAITNGSIGVNGMFVGSANTLSFCTAATERMKITSGGHLVAFADSTYDLGANATRWRQAYIDEIDIGANTSLAASASNAIFVGYAGGGSEYGVEIKTDASTGVAVYFLHSTTTACGSISVGSSATAYNTSSDYRLKENVVDMSGAITRLKTLTPKRFSWIADENSELLDGFLAHEVDEVVPQAIHGEKDETKDVGTIKDADGNVLSENVLESAKEHGQTWEKTATENIYQGIDQAKLVPLLTGALQEAITKIESLEARVAALET